MSYELVWVGNATYTGIRTYVW